MANGITIDGPDDTGIAYSAFFNDPDGHLLELTTYHAPIAVAPPPGVRTKGAHAK